MRGFEMTYRTGPDTTAELYVSFRRNHVANRRELVITYSRNDYTGHVVIDHEDAIRDFIKLFDGIDE